MKYVKVNSQIPQHLEVRNAPMDNVVSTNTRKEYNRIGNLMCLISIGMLKPQRLLTYYSNDKDRLPKNKRATIH